MSTLRLRGRYKRLKKNMDSKMKGLVEGKFQRKVKEDVDSMTKEDGRES
jgi:hypothetical protein